MPLIDDLKPKNNSAASFFPVTTNNSNNKYDWDSVVGFFIKTLHSLELADQIKAIEDFQALCKAQIEPKLDGESFWPIIEKMYFDSGQVLKIAPEMQALKVLDSEASSAGDERLNTMFVNLMGELALTEKPITHLNFLEREIKQIFDSPLVTKSNKKTRKQHAAYVPQIAKQFQNDLNFLVGYPEQFQLSIKSLLKLYGFLYTAQLSLNIKGWANEPSIKPCFFILDSEKASKERTKLKLHGHKQVVESSYSLFPLLSLNESLQDSKGIVVPLWQLVQELTEADIDKLNQYAQDFYEDRKLTSKLQPACDVQSAITMLSNLFREQFKKGTSREAAFNKFVNGTRETFIKPFEQSRGPAGSFLVLNQDYLLLLTNLAIGERERLRLHELLIEFQKRGVFFDKSSEECLMELFERMGNVERMSDSGDAVYVKKTI